MRAVALCKRYIETTHEAWRTRGHTKKTSRIEEERAFLPSHLELQERPASPLAHRLQYALLSIFTLVLLWACIGRIDVVATASGKVVPSGHSKIIQANETAQVAAIRVDDGQRVSKGQVLVELDARSTQADINRLSNDWLAARIDAARAQSLLAAIDAPGAPLVLDGLPLLAGLQQQQAVQRWLQGQYEEYRASLAQADAEIAQMHAQRRAAQASVASLDHSLPISRKLVQDLAELVAIAAVPKHQMLERRQRLMEQERERATHAHRTEELSASIDAAQSRRAGVVAAARRGMLDLLNEAEQRSATLSEELDKARLRHGLRKIQAPVDGTVQQLAIHTPGGTVTAAQALMILVPGDQPVEVEARLPNKDVGFVAVGQAVEMKVETFNFTRYGIVRGRVISVSDDAVDDEQRGLLYNLRIAVDGSEQALILTPGMAVSAEIKTDRRRLISYFLSPLQQWIGESLKER